MRVLRIFLFFGFLGISNFSVAQDHERIDATISFYPNRCNSPEELSKFISRDFHTDEEKVRAIYSWLIKNVAYDPKEYKQFDYRFSNYRERNKKEEITREKIIIRTLQNGKAVCEGYAFVFEKLCELQGITSYLVRGNTKTSTQSIGEKYEVNHMWNVAYIDGKPYLFDATWGAGKYQDKFIKEPNYYYYRTKPGLFINTHYPDIYVDALIEENLSKETFSSMPLIIKQGLYASDIQKPKNGILQSEEYSENILFLIRTTPPNSISYSYNSEIIPINEVKKTDTLIEFSIPKVEGESSLIVYFEDQPALGYKID